VGLLVCYMSDGMGDDASSETKPLPLRGTTEASWRHSTAKLKKQGRKGAEVQSRSCKPS